MADALLTCGAEELLKKVYSLAANEMILAWGFKDDFATLRGTLEAIQAVLVDAERKQESDQAVKRWLKKLVDLAYEVDYALDELLYELLRRTHRKATGQKGVSAWARRLKGIPSKVSYRSKMSQMIKEINMLFMQINTEASDCGLQQEAGVLSPQPQVMTLDQETDFMVDDFKLIGRDDDALELVQILIDPNNEIEDLPVIPIVGISGLGKTALAKMVYKHQQVSEHFDVIITLCASGKFDVNVVLLAILKCLTSRDPIIKDPSRKKIIGYLWAELQWKRYLLVLDDVRNEDRDVWEDFRSCMLKVNKGTGGVILATTRSFEVASIMATKKVHHLNGLTDENCWSIIEERAFAVGGPLWSSQLEEIGKEIAKKCRGVPLVAKIAGGMLRSRRDRAEWLQVLEDEAWVSVMSILRFSFDHLPNRSVKNCFVYCAIFPKDSLLNREQLIQFWMASGLLQPDTSRNKEMEDIGDEVFKCLLQWSLFQDIEKDECGNITFCKMHDLAFDLAFSLTTSEDVTSDATSDASRSNNEIARARHLSIHSGNEEVLEVAGEKDKENAGLLQTLFFTGKCISLDSFRCLRILNFSNSSIECVPDSVGELSHLRYLDLSRTPILHLPQSISRLYNLQTLRLVGCPNLRKYPVELRNLINLRHLYLCEDADTPPEMGRLTNLQTFQFFHVGDEKGHRISELGCLRNLRGQLKICNLQKVSSKEEAQRADLAGKSNLYKLELVWSVCSRADQDILEGLQPHPNLKSLTIIGFPGHSFPEWVMTMALNNSGVRLELNNLVTVRLDYCTRCQHIPMFGQLPRLRVLELESLDEVKSMDTMFNGGNDSELSSRMVISGGGSEPVLFPALRTLTLRSLGKLKNWMEPERSIPGRVFPCLEKLNIRHCYQLPTALPNIRFRSLRVLDINSCYKLSRLVPDGMYSTLASLEELNISQCNDDLESLASLRGCFTSLRLLKVEHCKILRSLLGRDDDVQMHRVTFPCLQSLEILKCPNLEYIQSLQGLTSLCEIKIGHCEALTSLQSGLLSSCKSLTFLQIDSCDNLASLPALTDQRNSLTRLEITACRGLRYLPEGFDCLTALKKLKIGRLSKELKSLPEQLQYLTSLKSLYLWEFATEALPEWIGNFSRLQKLCIDNFRNLECLPTEEAMQRLTKLNELTVVHTELLKGRCQTGDRPEWSKISHIPKVIFTNFYGYEG